MRLYRPADAGRFVVPVREETGDVPQNRQPVSDEGYGGGPPGTVRESGEGPAFCLGLVSPGQCRSCGGQQQGIRPPRRDSHGGDCESGPVGASRKRTNDTRHDFRPAAVRRGGAVQIRRKRRHAGMRRRVLHRKGTHGHGGGLEGRGESVSGHAEKEERG